MVPGMEGPPWVPPDDHEKLAPNIDRPVEDLRWRPALPLEGPPDDQAARTRKAVMDQCGHARIPGYAGFVPSKGAEQTFGHTAAATGRASMLEQSRRLNGTAPPSADTLGPGWEAALLRSTSRGASGKGSPPGSEGGKSVARQSASGTPFRAQAVKTLPDEHPLGKSRALLQRNHWVPTIPGYGGHIPGKHSEGICGGGVAATCRMAGRAIAERSSALPGAATAAAVAQQDVAVERDRLAANMREHCSSKIPGYTGHIPRVKGESVYGTTFTNAGSVAADLCEDRIFEPEAHAQMYYAPQVGGQQQMRA